MATTDITLTLPTDRVACVDWIKEQPPEIVADLLEATEVLFTTIATATQHSPADVVRAHTEEVRRLRATHDATLAEVRASVEKKCAADAAKRLAVLETQLHASRTQVECAQTALADVEARLTHQQALQEKNEIHMQKMVEAATSSMTDLRTQYEARIAAETTLHTQTVERLQLEIARESAKRIDDAHLVKTVHAELQLGTLTHAADNGAYERYEWKHAPAVGPDVHAIVRVKRAPGSSDEDAVGDVADANAVLMISLADRYEGRPKIVVEMHDSVPVLWASRNVDDALSAATLVEVAFTTFAHVWGHLSINTDAASMREAMAFIETATREAERMGGCLAAIDGATDTIRTNATHLRKSRDRILGYRFRAIEHEERVVETSDRSFKEHLQVALAAYYTKRKRYTTKLTDLGISVSKEHEAAALRVLAAVVEDMKSSKYRSGAVQRGEKRKGGE